MEKDCIEINEKDFENSKMNALAFQLFINRDEIFRLPGNQLKIYLYIYTQVCKSSNFDEGAIITVETFSKELDISTYTVTTAIKNLVKLELIKAEVSHKFGTKYFIL